MQVACAAEKPAPPVGETARTGAARLLAFAVVGSIGFVVDTGVLLLAVQVLGIAPLPARVLSFLCAASATYWLNRRYTFAATAGAAKAQWLRYLLAAAVGAAINIGIFYLWISVAGVRPLQLVAASAAGALVAMTFNYFVAKTLVFPVAARERS